MPKKIQTPLIETPATARDDDENRPAPGEGLVYFYIRKLFGRSWKTGLAGLFILLGTVGEQLAAGGLPDTLPEWLRLGTQLGMGSGLMVAKDGDKSGTDTHPR